MFHPVLPSASAQPSWVTFAGQELRAASQGKLNDQTQLMVFSGIGG